MIRLLFAIVIAIGVYQLLVWLAGPVMFWLVAIFVGMLWLNSK